MSSPDHAKHERPSPSGLGRPTRKRIAARQPTDGNAHTAPRSEHLVEKRLLNYLKQSSLAVQFKMGVDGWPDRILCYRGVFIGVEIKSERINHHPTVRQKQRLEQIQKAGGLVGVVRRKEELQDILQVVDTWYERTGGLPWSHTR